MKMTKKKARHFVDTLTEQFGVIPFLVEMLLSEDSEVIEDMYAKMTKTEKQFIFDRENVPLEKTIGLERRLKHKIERIRRIHDTRRKTPNFMHSCV